MNLQVLSPLFNQSARAQPRRRVTYAQALKIFDAFADWSDLAMNYPDDGCHARAHLMCAALEHAGFKPKKIWACAGFEENGEKRFFRPAIAGKKDIEWHFHVAPALQVILPDGQRQTLVFDPALFNAPVLPEEWGRVFGAKKEQLEIKPFGIAPSFGDGDYDMMGAVSKSWAMKDACEVMERYCREQGAAPRSVWTSARREAFAQKQPKYTKTIGRSWQAAGYCPA